MKIPMNTDEMYSMLKSPKNMKIDVVGRMCNEQYKSLTNIKWSIDKDQKRGSF